MGDWNTGAANPAYDPSKFGCSPYLLSSCSYMLRLMPALTEGTMKLKPCGLEYCCCCCCCCSSMVESECCVNWLYWLAAGKPGGGAIESARLPLPATVTFLLFPLDLFTDNSLKSHKNVLELIASVII